MKLSLFCGCVALCCLAWGEVDLTVERIEVVEPPRSDGPVRFAVQEMTNALSRVFGTTVPVVRKPTGTRVALHLGDSEWTRAAGVDVAALPRDAFIIRTVGTNAVVIAGRDGRVSRFFDRPDYAGTPFVEHATSFGVYAFLERFAGARFFFPGELGTILPRAERLVIPETDWCEVPDSPVRRYYNHWADGRWFDTNMTERAGKSLNWARTRMSSLDIPCCHGVIRFKYVERFKESHPEYFALKSDGDRWFAPTLDRPDHGYGHLCWSSAITNEIFLDAKSYLTGGDASVRGIPGGWGRNCVDRKYVDIMPNDALQYCLCPACTAAKSPGENCANDVIWKATAGIAQRLLDEGVPGFITQMSYSPYRAVPSFTLPSNVLVMVAVNGPFSLYDEDGLRRQFERTKAWMDKTGHKVWQWTYPGKVGARTFKNVPDVCPRAWGRFYQEMSPYSFGAFAESETDRWFYHHLNYYVFGKVLWNTKCDVDALLNDYYHRMYGAAAEDVRTLFEALEDTWLKEVVGRIVETSLGPVCAVPSEYELWSTVYTGEQIKSWKDLLVSALKKVGHDSLEMRRLHLISREILEPLDIASTQYIRSLSVEAELRRRTAHPEEVNIIVDGDFTDKTNDRFCGKWYADEKGPFPVVTNEFVVGGRCVELKADGTGRTLVCQYLPDLKPGTRYRLSFFLKLQNVCGPMGKGGAGVTLMDACNRNFPAHTFVSGTMDWRHFVFEFTTHPETNRKHRSYIRLRLSKGCEGTAWFDGVRLFELSSEKKENGNE